MDLEHERRLADVEGRCKSNTHRIDKLEELTDAVNRLATSTEVFANKLSQTAEAVDKLDDKVSAIESKPAKRWESFVEKVFAVAVTAILSFLLGKFGL